MSFLLTDRVGVAARKKSPQVCTSKQWPKRERTEATFLHKWRFFLSGVTQLTFCRFLNGNLEKLGYSRRGYSCGPCWRATTGSE